MATFNSLNALRRNVNKLIGELTEQGYTYPTQYSYMQEAYDQIIIPSGMKNAGTIKSLTETNRYIEKRFGKGYTLPKEEYEERLQSLLEKLEDVRTERKFKAQKRQQYQDDIYDALGEELDLSDYTTEELRDAISDAWDRAREDPHGSPTFAEHLAEILSGE